MTIQVCLAGATGWAGSALAHSIATTGDIEIVAAVSRRYAGQSLGDVLVEPKLESQIYATAYEALAYPCDVFFEYTQPAIAKSNALLALSKGAHVVIGTSGLSEADFVEIDEKAAQSQRGVLAVGNFALTAVLLLKFAEIAARFIPRWEIIDYAHEDKRDSPSGTARELANRLAKIRASELTIPLEQTEGIVETRGARINGSQVHSIRLPGYTISVEVIFGMPDLKLTLRHDSGSSAQPYVEGALLAIRKVGSFVGLRRGLDSVLDLG